MLCPFCKVEDTKVIDSRLIEEGAQVRRRRMCPQCQERFTTFEMAELAWPRVIKRNGDRAVFEPEKLKNGIMVALEKRPVATDAVALAIAAILRRVRDFAEKEVPSETLGSWVMEELKPLDEVAYVRFASVYRRFQDIYAFREEVNNLLAKNK